MGELVIYGVTIPICGYMIYKIVVCPMVWILEYFSERADEVYSNESKKRAHRKQFNHTPGIIELIARIFSRLLRFTLGLINTVLSIIFFGSVIVITAIVVFVATI